MEQWWENKFINSMSLQSLEKTLKASSEWNKKISCLTLYTALAGKYLFFSGQTQKTKKKRQQNLPTSQQTTRFIILNTSDKWGHKDCM